MNNQILTGEAVIAANMLVKAVAANGGTLEYKGRDDAPFIQGIAQAILHKGGGSNAQKDWAIRLIKRHGLNKEFKNELAKRVNAPAKNDAGLVRLGGGAFRNGYQHPTANLVIKQACDPCGKRHNALEAERYATTTDPLIKASLCPSWLEGDDLICLKVNDYVDTGKFVLQADGTWKHNGNGRSISDANAKALMATCKHFGLWDAAFRDNDAHRTQGGWLGDWFVITDYAL